MASWQGGEQMASHFEKKKTKVKDDSSRLVNITVAKMEKCK